LSHKVVFMGTPEFAVPALQALLDADDIDVVGVVTQPDRRAGRGQKVRLSPVKQLAVEHDIPLYQPAKLRGDEAIAQLKAWAPVVYVVVAYGQILRKKILAIPERGSVNVHGSILPRWRGASPIQAAIRAGDAETGITIMLMDEGMDTGPMLYKDTVPIEPDETAQSLHDKLAEMSGEVLLAGLRGYLNGEIQPEEQSEDGATYANLIKKEDGQVDWALPAMDIDRLVRAFTPWPGAFTYWDNQLLKIRSGHTLNDNPQKLKPGEVSLDDPDAPLVIGTGGGRYAPDKLQLEGRKALGVEDFVNGFQEIHGVVLGTL
jgi:methionyl-tRNA formyltransferase